jgi:hypothetical protein
MQDAQACAVPPRWDGLPEVASPPQRSGACADASALSDATASAREGGVRESLEDQTM